LKPNVAVFDRAHRHAIDKRHWNPAETGIIGFNKRIFIVVVSIR